jgi:N-acetylmuramoyl-L-alanine amidase
MTMPSVFLSPSTQESNPYINGGSEEYFMNLVADAVEPYLRASGITYARNSPEQTLSQAIAQSNAGNYDLHLAIHSNAAGSANSGNVRGTDVYYYPTSVKGKRAADIIVENYKDIYPLPERVKTVASAALAELRRTKAPAVLIETAYHDNREDARWIRDNLDNIARALSKSVAEYLNVPFKEP